MQQLTHLIIIAGAGPAGLATSIMLTAYNIPHCIIDAQCTPTKKQGEAIPPNAKPLLKELGILDLLNHQKHLPYYGNKSVWGSNKVQQKEFIKEVYGHGYLLDRLFFENQLRTLVDKNKVPFYKGYQIKKVENIGPNIQVKIQKDSDYLNIQGSYIIDATGKKASICRHLGISKINIDSQFTISFKHQLTKSLPREIWIEATENGWWYIAPNANNNVNCMFFTLKNLIPLKENMSTFLENELNKTIHLKKQITPSKKELLSYHCTPSGTSFLKQPYGNNWLAVGDAAFSYDPISSYGITSALASGYYGAHAIASKLANEENAFLTYQYVLQNGFNAYLQKLTHQYNTEQRWKTSYYWKNRLTTY